MQIANREGFAAARRRGWTNPYITDGLVAMWDGEWNAGGGVHDASATSWKNLVSGSIYADITKGSPYATYWQIGAATYTQTGTFVSPRTIEVVVVAIPSNLDTYYPLSYGSRGDQSGGGLSFLRLYNRSVSLVYYAGNRNGLLGSRSGTTPRMVLRLNSAASCTYDVGGSTGTNTTAISGFSLSTQYNSFIVNASAKSADYTRFRAIRLYSRALSDAELAANYAIDRERFGLT